MNTTLTRPQDVAINWREWRCVCGAFLVAYDPNVPCHLQRVCPKCKKHNVLDRTVEK